MDAPTLRGGVLLGHKVRHALETQQKGVCRDKLQMALEELAKDKEGHYFLTALRDIISTFVSYRATDTPPFVTHCLQRVSCTTHSSHRFLAVHCCAVLGRPQ